MALAGLLLAATAQAQEAPGAAPAGSPPGLLAQEPAAPETDPVAAQGKVTTLGEVRAVKPDDEPLDLYRFKNPVKIENNRFSKQWSEPPTPEQVSHAGGYIMLGVVKGVTAAAKAVNKMTGGPDQIQHAIARPPPQLNADEQRRALQFCQQQEGCDAAAGN
ncbi:MAG: hypothetical protein GAK31_03491 [Stenotrophomonas maltophilia]|uniref:Uncharacterized protein n=1 Tax=Stenotrophomonas maltophilia TaxID=40324 RepID=A0A7V8FDP9_STEMA|nr:MAG: hypothetical protein GAK31_03491 [Stenotrophomonas maltophilia]